MSTKQLIPASLITGLAAAMSEVENPNPFRRMPQKDFEAAVRAKARHQIEIENRKRKEREENPREKKRTKKIPTFSNNYIGMPKKVKEKK